VTAQTVVVEEHLEDADVVAIVTPLFHVAALNIMFQPAVLIGATSVFLPAWGVAPFTDMVERFQVTAAFMVPVQAAQLVAGDELDPARFRSWRKLSFAGAPMPDQVQLELLRQLPELRLTQIYGQSEMGVLTALPSRFARSKLGSVGRQAYNVDIAVLKPDGSPCRPGEIGEVVSRGDNLMRQYYAKPEETATFFRRGDGWGWSGDLGYLDAEGFLYLVDRSKDMIISGGENVYPKEIEEVIYQLDAVAECAVFGVPDDEWGELPATYVILKPGRALSEAEIVEHCALKLARFKRPRLVKFVADLPRTAIGKVQKSLLKEPYWQGREKRI
jgi:fatty-acyl-CoA synthase